MSVTVTAVAAATAKILFALATAIGIDHVKDWGQGRVDASDASFESYKKYINKVKELGLSNSVDTKDVMGQLYLSGAFSKDEYSRALEIIETSADKYDEDSWWRWLTYDILHTKKTHANIGELWEKAADYTPVLKRISNMTADEVNAAIQASTPPQSKLIAAPNYNDTNIDVDGSLKEVDPVKFWSGQELADLHSIDYDPNSYYDLIKQGTEGQVDLARFTSDQMNNASLYDDMANRTSYLDAIRNNKAEALATGATLGQRAANEVLASKEAIASYASNQADVANARLQAVDKALLDDANAKLATREYFDKLAQSLSQDSLTLYANDTDRFGQDWLSNAERYKANQALLAQNLVSNAEMYSNYVSANAQINNYNKQATAKADEISWVFNNALKAFDNDVYKAFNYTTNAIASNYTNKDSLFDYLSSGNN